MRTISTCTLHSGGHGRLILTIPRSLFGDMAYTMREVISRKLFPLVHDGSYPCWESTLDDAYQVEVSSEESADQLVALIEEWVSENV
jgi:2-phosphoglycerate kinase